MKLLKLASAIMSGGWPGWRLGSYRPANIAFDLNLGEGVALTFSEASVIRLIRQKTSVEGGKDRLLIDIGDDAAALSPRKDEAVVLSTDALVEGVHFRLDWASPLLIGQKATLASLSDLIAMGSRPAACLCSLGLPKDLTLDFVESLIDGVLLAATDLGATLAGGNVSASRELFISSTVVGHAPAERLVTRSGARVGDSVYVTGSLGGAAVAANWLSKQPPNGPGLLLTASALEEAVVAGAASEGVPWSALQRFWTPTLRLREATLLSEYRICSAMIDISDGLASDLRHICEESGVGAVVWKDRVPVFDVAEVGEMCDRSSLFEMAMYGGEDYELLFTVRPQNEAHLARLLGEDGFCSVTKVGQIVERSEGILLASGSGCKSEMRRGFDHFTDGE